MTIKKSGSSKFTIAIGSLIAVALILGVLYKTGSLSKQDELELLGVIPEQTVIEPVNSDIAPPSANIPQQSEVSAAASQESDQTSEVAVEVQAEPVETPAAPRLPELDSSDDYVRANIAEQSNNKMNQWLKPDDLIRRSASFMDGLARGTVSEKVFPLGVAEGKFTTHRQDGNIG